MCAAVATGAAATPFVVSGSWLVPLCQIAGVCVVLGSAFRNIPQLAACWRKGRAEGVSMVALFTEVMCYSALIAYQARKSYDLSTWADVLLCCGQDFILLGLVATLQGHSKKKVLAGGTLMLGCIAMLYNEQLVPITFLARCQIGIGAVLGLGARVPQIIINWQRGNTGDLHPAAFLFNSVANAVKLGCIFVLTGDRYMMAICLWMLGLNAVTLGQIMRSHQQKKQGLVQLWRQQSEPQDKLAEWACRSRAYQSISWKRRVGVMSTFEDGTRLHQNLERPSSRASWEGGNSWRPSLSSDCA